MSTVAAGLVLQELSRADASFCVVFGATSSLAMTTIAMLGSEEQKQRWLPPMAALRDVAQINYDPAGHRSDLSVRFRDQIANLPLKHLRIFGGNLTLTVDDVLVRRRQRSILYILNWRIARSTEAYSGKR